MKRWLHRWTLGVSSPRLLPALALRTTVMFSPARSCVHVFMIFINPSTLSTRTHLQRDVFIYVKMYNELSQRFRKDRVLIFFPTHCTNIDFATLQQPAFHATCLSLFLIVHGVYVLSSKRTETSLKVKIFHHLPYHQNFIRMQWNSIRD